MKVIATDPISIAYDPEVYSSFPTIIRVGRDLLCVYREADCHHPNWSKLIQLRSSDGGVNWSREVLREASLEADGFVFNCPSLNVLKDKIVLVCDTKSGQRELECKWETYMWWSNDHAHTWGPTLSMDIRGLVPDQMVALKHKLVMGYHVIEPVIKFVEKESPAFLVQMMAESFDNGRSWRDRRTVAFDPKHEFCEGSIAVVRDRMFCYLRDNKGPTARSYVTTSNDEGQTWAKPVQLNIKGHRIVACAKKRDPYSGAVIGTFRNTENRNLSLFVHNVNKNKMQIFPIDKESKNFLYDYGYSGWTETDDGGILVAYYICRNKPNPEICISKIDFF